MIRENPNIKAIKMKDLNTLISLFADDTTLYLDGSERSFKEAKATLDNFAPMSGLNINNDKTHIVWIWSRKNSNIKYMTERNYIWDHNKLYCRN